MPLRELFRRRPKGWISITDYARLRERVMKRNPDRVAHELEQASQWSVRVAERKLKERSQRSTEEKSSG